MKQGVIVLTSGLTGSSVLTGLIAHAGYWTGLAMHDKVGEYSTYENTRLIELNRSLFTAAGYTGNYLTEFCPALLRQMDLLAGSIDVTPYREFLAQCDRHSPWIWKDPRLWSTIRFWSKLLDPRQCRFILLTRSLFYSWVSVLQRGQIRGYRNLRSYETAIVRASREFVEAFGAPAIEMCYEDLILHPAESIGHLNQFLGVQLSVADLESLYHKPLYRSPNGSAWDVARAVLIYAANYSRRVERKLPGGAVTLRPPGARSAGPLA
jgi:hypothetical protein